MEATNINIDSLDLLVRPVLDEDGLAPPLDRDALPGLHCGEVDLDGGKCKDVSGRRQSGDGVDDGQASRGRVQETSTTLRKSEKKNPQQREGEKKSTAAATAASSSSCPLQLTRTK